MTYLRLGKVFSSVITGNLALLGVSAGQRNAGLALNGGLALAGYGLGVLAGGAFARTPEDGQPTWPRRVTVMVPLAVVAACSLHAAAGDSGQGVRLRPGWPGCHSIMTTVASSRSRPCW